MKKATVSEVKEQLSEYLKLAEGEDILILKRGRPVGILIAFPSEDDYFDYIIQKDPRFVSRMKKAEKSMAKGEGVRLEDIDDLFEK